MAQLGIALDGDYIAPDRAKRTAELLAKQRELGTSPLTCRPIP
jgi:hypothetical protein